MSTWTPAPLRFYIDITVIHLIQIKVVTLKLLSKWEEAGNWIELLHNSIHLWHMALQLKWIWLICLQLKSPIIRFNIKTILKLKIYKRGKILGSVIIIKKPINIHACMLQMNMFHHIFYIGKYTIGLCSLCILDYNSVSIHYISWN